MSEQGRRGEKEREGGRPLAASAVSGRSPLNAIYVQVCVAMQTGYGSTDEHFFTMGRSQNKVDCLMTVMQSWMDVYYMTTLKLEKKLRSQENFGR